MEPQKNHCCSIGENKKNRGILSGIMFGLLPHAFCLAFALFSIIGAVTASAFLKRFLLIPNFFLLLTAVSFILATISAVVYLRKSGRLSVSGLKNRWRYILAVYVSTILVNLMIFFVVFPALANMDFSRSPKVQGQAENLSELAINVQIPCSGHAPLIIDEIKKNCDVQSVKFLMPNIFYIKYDPNKITPEKVISLEVFKTYKAVIN